MEIGNKILEEKIMIKIPKNKNIGDKLFLNSLERNFGRKKNCRTKFLDRTNKQEKEKYGWRP